VPSSDQRVRRAEPFPATPEFQRKWSSSLGQERARSASCSISSGRAHRAEASPLAGTKLAEHQRREASVRGDIAWSEPARLLQHPEEPLEPETLEDPWGGAGRAGQDVDGTSTRMTNGTPSRVPSSPRKYSLRGELIATNRISPYASLMSAQTASTSESAK
jgi:hypothetical protein